MVIGDMNAPFGRVRLPGGTARLLVKSKYVRHRVVLHRQQVGSCRRRSRAVGVEENSRLKVRPAGENQGPGVEGTPVWDDGAPVPVVTEAPV